VLVFVGALLLGGAVFYIVFTTQIAAASEQMEDRLNFDLDKAKNSAKIPVYIRLTRPMLKSAYLNIALGFWKPEAVKDWKRKLVSAGLGRIIQPEVFVGAKFWLTMMIGAFMLMLLVFAETPPPLWFAGGFTLFAFFYPNLHIKGLRDERQQQIRVTMPYVVDLLSLSTEAGLDFMGSIQKVVQRAPQGPFVEELENVLKDIQLGKTRAEALRDMAVRVDMGELSSFVAVLVSSDQMGASVGSVLRAQSDSMRTERLVKAEKLGAQASTKILVPIAFFILPSVLLMIFAPMLIGLITGVGK